MMNAPKKTLRRLVPGALLIPVLTMTTPSCTFEGGPGAPVPANQRFVGCFQGPNLGADAELTLILRSAAGDFSLDACLALDADVATLAGEVLADDPQRADLDGVFAGEPVNLDLLRSPVGDTRAVTVVITATNEKLNSGELERCEPVIEFEALCPPGQFRPSAEDLGAP